MKIELEKLIKAAKDFKEYQSIGNGAKLNCAIEEAEKQVKNCCIPDVVLSLPDDEAIEQWWAEGKESDKFWQDAPYRTNGDVVEEIKAALKYFITVWQ